MDSAADWGNMPNHLLDLVVERIPSTSDYLRFTTVCMTWHYVAQDHKQRRANMLSDSPPMLLIPTGEKNIWNVYDVMNGELLSWQLRVPHKRFCGSSKGWLILVEKDLTITLINPFFKVIGRRKEENSIIRLPPLALEDVEDYGSVTRDYYVTKATISADPILNANDCIVAVLYLWDDQLAFIRPGKDINWTYVDKRYTLIEEVLFVGDRIYAVDDWNRLLSLDITTQSHSNVKVVAGVTKHPSTDVKRYIVNLNQRELLMIQRFHVPVEDGERRTNKFKIFNFNFDKCKWITVKTLGDFAIFLGESSSISVIASKIQGCQTNCIYFIQDAESQIPIPQPYEFGMYNVKSQSFSKPYTACAMNLMTMANQPPMWVVPSFKL